MGKRLAILAVVLAVLQIPVSIQGQSLKVPILNSGKDENQGQGKKGASSQASPVVNKSEKAPISDPHSGQAEDDGGGHTVKIISLPPVTLTDSTKSFWDHIFDWGPWIFNFLLVVVGALQVWLLLWTGRAVARQANLQKFITKQWVDVGNWSIGGEDAWEIDWDFDTRTEKSRKIKQSMSMGVGFEIFNRTAYPMIVDTIVIFVGKVKQGEWKWKVFEDKANMIMPPHSSDGDNSESCTVPFDLDEDEVYRYTKCGIYRRIHVKIFFFDSEGKKVRQDFAKEALFGEKLTTTFSKYSSRRAREIQTPQTEENQENA
jgi:hypothetical protein